jgi:hypothetical protein
VRRAATPKTDKLVAGTGAAINFVTFFGPLYFNQERMHA